MNDSSPQASTAAVRLEQVSKRYAKNAPPAVDQVSLIFDAGRLTTLLGPSGCGKTTTLRMVAGLERATSGRIFIGDREVTHLPATQRDVSMVFQSYALFPHLRVEENIRYGLDVSGVPREQARARVEEVQQLLGLGPLAQRYPHELSGGQQQRVAVARALVLKPQVLLFDEPLSNLDAKLRRHVRQEIRDLQQSLGLTVIYVTHDQEEALAVSDTIVVMNNAVVAQRGTPREVYERPRTRFVADFMGEANVLPVQVAAQGDGHCRVDLAGQSWTLATPPEASEGFSGAWSVALRPDRVQVSLPSPQALWRGRVRRNTYLGDRQELLITTDVGDVLVWGPWSGPDFAVDAEVALAVPEADVVLVSG